MDFSSSDKNRLSEILHETIEHYHLPSIGLAVVDRTDELFLQTIGYSDIETSKQLNDYSTQRIGSITKTMVGLVIMAIVNEKRLRLDNRVKDLLPDLRFNGVPNRITLWNLLTHTSGIGESPTINTIDNPYSQLFIDCPPSKHLTERYPDGIDIECEAGTHWHYQNHGYALIGEIIRRTEAATIHDVLNARVFEPLSMYHSNAYDKPANDLTTGYHRVPGPGTSNSLSLLDEETTVSPVDGFNIKGPYKYIATPGAGEVQSTIGDMARYARALLNLGNGIVTPDIFSKMISFQYGYDPRMLHMGIAFQKRTRFDNNIFMHGGGVAGGWNTLLEVFPEKNFALVIHLNLQDSISIEVFSKITQAVLGLSNQPDTYNPVNSHTMSHSVGTYVLPDGRNVNFRPENTHGKIVIKKRESGLMLISERGKWRDGIRLLSKDPKDGDLLALDTGEIDLPTIILRRGLDGRVTGLQIDSLVLMNKVD